MMERGSARTSIAIAKHVIEREPLLSPFGFKGAYLTELWQSVASLRSKSGASGIGVGVQSILWSDANVFVRYGEQKGNEMMSALTAYALTEAEKTSFQTPLDLLDQLLPQVYEYGKQLTALPDLRLTFALNALVAVDYAAWALYAQEQGNPDFKALVPAAYRAALSARHTSLASIPVVSYGMSESDVTALLQEGHFLLKIKIGADPERDGDQEKMLEWDKTRLEMIHRIAGRFPSEHTDNGKAAYYLDANGRYENKERLLRFLEHADRIGALANIVLFEEPFPEDYKIDVSDIPVRFAADESVHGEADAAERIEMGYGAMALKPVAKTMSMSLKVAKLAGERGIPCFCADLTAGPLLVDWNKNMAAHLPSLPGLKVGAFETNGQQNYVRWDRMKSHHPLNGAAWTEARHGLFILNDEFYAKSGGALDESAYYKSLF